MDLAAIRTAVQAKLQAAGLFGAADRVEIEAGNPAKGATLPRCSIHTHSLTERVKSWPGCVYDGEAVLGVDVYHHGADLKATAAALDALLDGVRLAVLAAGVLPDCVKVTLIRSTRQRPQDAGARFFVGRMEFTLEASATYDRALELDEFQAFHAGIAPIQAGGEPLEDSPLSMQLELEGSGEEEA